MSVNSIAVFNPKGGVGKTTTAVHLAHAICLKNDRSKVLLIDFEHQASCSLWLSDYVTHGQKEGKPDLGHVLQYAAGVSGSAPIGIDEAIYPTSVKGIDLIPSCQHLRESLALIEPQPDRTDALSLAMKESKRIKDYDWVIIDTMGTIHMTAVYNVMRWVRNIVIPLDDTDFSLQAVSQFMHHFRRCQAHNDDLGLLGFFVSICKTTTNNFKSFMGDVSRHYKDDLLKTYISDTVAIKDSLSLQKTIFQHKPNHKVAMQFFALHDEILGKSITNQLVMEVNSLSSIG